jgi:outer membrane lipoprotein-sorting protein
MLRKAALPNIVLSLAICLTADAAVPNAPDQLTAAQIIDKDIAARGGLQAWRAIQTLSFSGKMEAGGKKNAQLPFLMELKRPRKSRVELEFAKDKAIQVYDGTNGWKLRPFLNRKDVERFTPDELKAASMESDLDGPLVDYAAKGTRVELERVEDVEGRAAYKLKLTMKSGQVRHLWVDTQTFLETKIEGTPRRMDGRMRAVEIYYRDYKNVNGLMVPYVLETTVQGVRQSRKITVETVLVNPKLDDSLFAAPNSK